MSAQHTVAVYYKMPAKDQSLSLCVTQNARTHITKARTVSRKCLFVAVCSIVSFFIIHLIFAYIHIVICAFVPLVWYVQQCLICSYFCATCVVIYDCSCTVS